MVLTTVMDKWVSRGMKLLLLVGLLFGSFGWISISKAETVKVGVALRFAPEKNSFAGSLYEGIELAAKEFNEKSETKVELVKYSHKEGHDSLDDISNKILKDKIHFVLGAEMSDDAFAIAESFQGKDVLLMTATASNPLLTAGRPNVFRTCFTDDQVADLFAKYVAGLKNAKAIGVLHNTANAYSDYVTNAFLDALEKARPGKFEIHEFRYATEQPKFDTAVQQFKKAGASIVVAFTLQEALKSFEALARQSGYDPQYIGSDGWGPTDNLLKAIPGFNGVRNEYWNESSKSPSVTKFKASFQKAYGRAPNGWNAIAFDSAQVLFESVAKAKNHNDVTEVAGLIREGNFPNVVTANSIKFSRNNSPKKPLYLYEIKSNKAQFLKAVE